MEKHELDEERIFVIRGFMTPQECARHTEVAEGIGFADAPISTSAGAVMRKDIRNNERVMHDDPQLAAELWARVEEFLPRRPRGWVGCGLNERFRWYRYDVGQRFNRHYDGYFQRESGETSALTLMIYLNEDFEGGETRFYPFHLDQEITVKPEQGMALVFVHRQLHEGMPVVRGRKYVLRTDIMFRPVED